MVALRNAYCWLQNYRHSLGIYFFVLGNFPDVLLNMVLKTRLIWTEFGLRPWIQWYNVGGNSFLCDYYILYHWSYAFFFLTNLYFVRCILREQQEKNVSTMNGFGRHMTRISLFEKEKLTLDILLLWISFFQVIFVCVEVALSETLSGNFGS